MRHNLQRYSSLGRELHGMDVYYFMARQQVHVRACLVHLQNDAVNFAMVI